MTGSGNTQTSGEVGVTPPVGPPDSHGGREHGTRNRYKTDGCRCGPCVAAAAAYRSVHPSETPRGGRPRNTLVAQRSRFSLTGEVPGGRHGTLSAYNVGCRCRECRGAMSEYRASRKAEDS